MIDERYALDTFAILTYYGGEDGADAIEELLIKARSEGVKLYINYVNLGEVYYIIFREEGVDKANEAVALMRRWPIEFICADERISLVAGRIKAIHPISYADAFAVATAVNMGAKVVTGDLEFRAVEDVVPIFWIK
ncbi:MAG: type II toxin-antitoxin system VapC family toxin [Methanocellales archaeon]|nr:type II toxin-antitoxin system VapC family toxin [Methanocellales archaeon]MDI6858955.1 type II toxin-antitoxin system VapC family toxin [Methanocellales archaeon]